MRLTLCNNGVTGRHLCRDEDSQSPLEKESPPLRLDSGEQSGTPARLGVFRTPSRRAGLPDPGGDKHAES